MGYMPRVVDRVLDELLLGLPAVVIDGPKAVGKTATARRRVRSRIDLDEPGEVELLRADRRRILELPHPLLVDEWQRHPPVWDQVRRAADFGAAPGSYLLTGSAGPHDAPMHSGAGRITRLRMRPLSLAERALDTPAVSLAGLLAGARPDFRQETSVALRDYAEEIAASGFPGIRSLPARARRAALDGYIDAIVEREFPDAVRPVRHPQILRGWLAAYGAATATTADYETIRAAANPGLASPPAKATTIAYRSVLERMWILDQLPGWTGTRNRLAALTVAPKHFLADPALAARLMGLDAAALVARPHPESAPVTRDGPTLGRLFEALVAQSVRVYAEAAETRVSHLRTAQGKKEIDLVVSRADGRVVAFEVKLAPVPRDPDVRNLLWLRDKLGEDLLDAAVITTGPAAYRRPDGIAVIPAALLGP